MWSEDAKKELKESLDSFSTLNSYSGMAALYLAPDNMDKEEYAKGIYDILVSISSNSPSNYANSNILCEKYGEASLCEILIRIDCVSVVDELCNLNCKFPLDDNRDVPAITWLITGACFPHEGDRIEERTDYNKRINLTMKLLQEQNDIPKGTLMGIRTQSKMDGKDTLALYVIQNFTLTPKEEAGMMTTAYEMDNGSRLFFLLLPRVSKDKKLLESFIQFNVRRGNESNDIDIKDNALIDFKLLDKETLFKWKSERKFTEQ